MPAGPPDNSPLPWFASVMYHRVVDEVKGSDPYALQISTRQFERQLAFLKENGYEAVAPERALAAAREGARSVHRKVALTFDDGYADFMTHALPLLQKYQYSAMVMLVSGEIGGSNTWDNGRAERAALMGKAEIRAAQSAGMTFGSHSKTHPKLSRLDIKDVRTEVRDSKSALEDLLGTRVPIFCYPHGDTSVQVRDAVIDAGYAAAFGNRQRDHELFNLSRFDGATAAGTGLSWRLHISGRHFRLGQRRRAIRQYLHRLTS